MRTRLFALALLGFPAITARADPVALKDTVAHITATGTASTIVTPDRAELRLGVAFERPEADAAAQATAKAATDVLAEIKARGIAAKDISTSIDLSAQFDVKRDDTSRVTEQKLRGYRASEAIDVKIDDVTRVGPLARALLAKGANSVEGVFFSYSRSKEARRALDAAAMHDAVAEARSYTDAVGLKLGRVLQIGEDPQTVDGAADMPSRRVPPSMGIALPMEPGSQTLTQNVIVIFEIEGTAR